MFRIESSVDVLAATSLADLDRLALSSAPPRLPIELCEYIIDWVYDGSQPVIPGDRELQGTLYTCTLVCRAWRTRARMHLFTNVTLSSQYLPTFERALRNDRHLLSLTNVLNIYCDPLLPISSLLVTHRFQNLKILTARRLNLAREHTWLSRPQLSHSIVELYLWEVRDRKVSRLIRFINSFHSLEVLTIFFASTSLEYTGQILPKPAHIPTRCRQNLILDLVPGVSTLIGWLLKAGSYLTYTEHLSLTCKGFRDKTKFRSCFEGVEELLHHCSATVEHLGVDLIRVPMVDEISDLFHLEALSQLRELSYWVDATSDVSFKYMARQLGTVSSEVGIEIITIRDGYAKPEQIRHLCGPIDSILTGGNFPSLATFQVPSTMLDNYFPNLQKAGILEPI